MRLFNFDFCGSSIVAIHCCLVYTFNEKRYIETTIIARENSRKFIQSRKRGAYNYFNHSFMYLADDLYTI